VVFQAFQHLPTFNALVYVQIPMFEQQKSAKLREENAVALLRAVGLEHRLRHLPATLSGGERQRVAIARSLANSPSVLLADEPTGNLDSESATNVLDLLVRLQQERNMTLILVTHDMGIAARAHRKIEMKDGHISSPSV
jgi:predicted ABC-type transport system involved in lysophospholipase L1 biosynthesis ATPase subunit